MSINSRKKGAIGEREFRDYLRAHGIEARRGQQFSGSPDSPDVVSDLDNIVHWEVKRVENLSLYPAMEQATRDSRTDQIPVVAHRRNRREWLAILPMDDFLRLVGQNHTRSATHAVGVAASDKTAWTAPPGLPT